MFVRLPSYSMYTCFEDRLRLSFHSPSRCPTVSILLSKYHSQMTIPFIFQIARMMSYRYCHFALHAYLKTTHVCHPLSFLQYSFIELCIQSALGVFQILKALILTRPIKIHSLKLWCKVYEIDPFFYVFIRNNQISPIWYRAYLNPTYVSIHLKFG